MSKLIIAIFASLIFTLQAQEPLYAELRKTIAREAPSVSAEGKILAFAVLDPASDASVNAATELSRTAHTYKVAKLSGGSKGFVGICIVDDRMMTLNRDPRFSELIFIPLSFVKGFTSSGMNAVFDSAGRLIYKDLPASQIFSSTQHLITR